MAAMSRALAFAARTQEDSDHAGWRLPLGAAERVVHGDGGCRWSGGTREVAPFGCNVLDLAQATAAAGFDHRTGFRHEPRALGVEPAVRP